MVSRAIFAWWRPLTALKFFFLVQIGYTYVLIFCYFSPGAISYTSYFTLQLIFVKNWYVFLKKWYTVSIGSSTLNIQWTFQRKDALRMQWHFLTPFYEAGQFLKRASPLRPFKDTEAQGKFMCAYLFWETIFLADSDIFEDAYIRTFLNQYWKSVMGVRFDIFGGK